MNKHTPGPWKWHDNGYPQGIRSDTGPGAVEICRIGGVADAPEDAWECDANARLIAAAPDLLEALEALADKAENVMGDHKAAIIDARAAIAKARGQQPDVFSLESLAAWLEKQPGETRYNYADSRDCLLCRYFRANGVPVWSLTREGFRLTRDGDKIPYPLEMGKVANYGNSVEWTYAAALDRARTAIFKARGQS